MLSAGYDDWFVLKVERGFSRRAKAMRDHIHADERVLGFLQTHAHLSEGGFPCLRIKNLKLGPNFAAF
jgi:hypothetical protein